MITGEKTETQWPFLLPLHCPDAKTVLNVREEIRR